MTFLYTARGIFDKTSNQVNFSWDKYIEWSKLTHLKELVSLDRMLNESLVEPDYDNADDWEFIHSAGEYLTEFYTTPEFVSKKMKPVSIYNMLTLVVEPTENCNRLELEGYEFFGYELLDMDYSTSALTNCGGFAETFSASDINNKGLIDDFEKAYDIKRRLLENNPQEYHADTNVIAIWRHKVIGR